jgi:hypothetical protein
MRAKRTDSNHRAVVAAIRALGCAVKSLHTQGGGVEDLLVGIEYDTRTFMGRATAWVLIEIKVPNKSGSVKPSKFTQAQRDWYLETEGFPRLVVTSAQDAVDQLRRLQG